MSNSSYYTCPTRGVMKVELPMNHGCPFCLGISNLHPRMFVYKNKTYLVFSYKCDECKEEFTTTESDEISVGSIVKENIKKKQLVLETVKSVLKNKHN